MKHLIRKANANNVEDIYEILNSNEFDANQVEKLINENPDYTFNSSGYRIFFFDILEIESLSLQHTEEADDVDDLLEIVISLLINITGSFSSFLKSMNGIKTYKNWLIKNWKNG